jgi:hypothetical protein
MKIVRLVAVVLAGALTTGCSSAAVRDTPAPIFPVAAVIAQIKHELAAAQNTAGASVGLALEKVDVTLAVSRVVEANGKVSVGVPAIGLELGGAGSRKGEEASTVAIQLLPPKGTGTLSATPPEDLGLTQMIVQTRAELLKGLNEEPKLDAKQVVMTVKFALSKTVGPTGQLKFVVVTIGGGGTVTATNTNTVVLTFSRVAAP